VTPEVDQYYILASAPPSAPETRVLKHGETFALFDGSGDIVTAGLGEQGLYHRGTRHLSRYELRINGRRPILLSSMVRDRNELLTVDLTNPDLVDGSVILPRGTLHLFRTQLLWEGALHERVRVTNFGLESAAVDLSYRMDADFRDVFEVRGTRRARRGERLSPEISGNGMILSYRGRDGVIRRTQVDTSLAPEAIEADSLHYGLHIAPQSSITIVLACGCHPDGATSSRPGFDAAAQSSYQALSAARSRGAGITTSNEQANGWLNRSLADLHMMVTELPSGAYPYAGVPWFSTPFGRDGIITAFELLWADPALAAGVLRLLADTQARRLAPKRDAEPGKIMHELRQGEMAALGEIPFGRYYGSIDSTPLFVMLAGAYYQRTGDLGLIAGLWDALESALHWIDEFGDLDGDGLVEYRRRAETGLLHQGWKDSSDPVSHADGALAEPPIALCEVQGYTYAARRAGARLAAALQHPARARALERSAENLRLRFEKAFWLEDRGHYAMALDARKKPCRVLSSNAGQVLWSGVCSPERAVRTAERLMQEDSFSGFGIRTLASSAARYNPMSYHNGSVWPHDNALIAAGFARYGLTAPAGRILAGIFEASQFLDLHRMPELFCGFRQRPGEGPTRYPLACAPQAWAAGAACLLLASSLGMSIDALTRRITFANAYLPPFLDEVEIRGLIVAGDEVDLRLRRCPQDVGIQILRRTGPIEIVSMK